MRYFLGVDPGKEGGVAVVDAEGRLVETWPTPLVEGKGRGEYNVPAIAVRLRGYASTGLVTVATIELLQALPPIARVGLVGGSGANFARGLSHGWSWALEVLEVRFELVRPQAWQARMLEPGPAGTSKARSIAAAVARWPSHDFRRTPRSKGPHDGLADAANLAEYGRLMTHASSAGLSEHETCRLFARQKGIA
jgi:hypothetical protein